MSDIIYDFLAGDDQPLTEQPGNQAGGLPSPVNFLNQYHPGTETGPKGCLACFMPSLLNRSIFL